MILLKTHTPLRQSIKFCIFTLAYIAVFALILAYTFRALYLPREHSAQASLDTSPMPRIVIDPGHGGRDGGAEGSGLIESLINLEVAYKLKALLALADVPYLMTRDTDVLLADEGAANAKRSDLQGRTEIANTNPEAYFVSVHMNKFGQSRYRGLQVYYSPNNPLSQALAQSIQLSARELLMDGNTREPKDGSNLYILKNALSPAVIVECGFLSNPEEAALLADEMYQRKIALVIFKGLMEQLEIQDLVVG